MSKKKFVKKQSPKKSYKRNKVNSNTFIDNKKKRRSNNLIENTNPILLELEKLFALLYNNFCSEHYILKKLNLNREHIFNLKNILDLLKRFTLIKTGGEKYKLNIKNIKETQIPKYFLLQVSNKNALGEIIATFPSFYNKNGNHTIIVDKPCEKLQANSYFLAKLTAVSKSILKATVLSVFPIYTPEIIKGLVTINNGIPFLIPLGRKYKSLFKILNYKEFSLQNNSLVEAKVANKSKFNSEVTITKIITNKDLSEDLSLLTAYEFNLPLEFNQAIIEESNNLAGLPKNLKNYTDLRHLPLVTIDGIDAKDFDDAVFVEQISSSPIKYKATIAIADVSSYVKENTLLNKEALNRGNSTYLPGLVIPMLPEVISNMWCSLKPNEDRASLAVDLIINEQGIVEDYKFYQAIIQSKARLTYEDVEDAINGNLNPNTKPLLEQVILPMYNCWQLLNKASIKRNTLQIQAKEYQAQFNPDKTIKSIVKKEEKQSHKIIAELMIAANVAATKFLKKHKLKNFIIYRIHEQPSTIKIEHFLAILKSFSIKFKSKEKITTKFFNDLLNQYKKSNIFNILNENVLSSQSQAKYSTNNIGHFGLVLKDYCHFTSPIRRYADLVIHRLITSILNEQKIELNKENLEEVANQISLTERNSSSAEYSALEKIIAALLNNKIGLSFSATIVNITNAGLFIALDENGAQGLIPMRTLGNERFIFAKEKNMLIGCNTKTQYKIGQNLTVILKEVNILKGLLTFIIE